MSDIDLWNKIHSLGYAKSPPVYTVVYTNSAVKQTLLKDTSDNTYYDSEKQAWYTLEYFECYTRSSTVSIYLREDKLSLHGYTQTDSVIPTHAEYKGFIYSIDQLKTEFGFSDTLSITWTTDKGEDIVWYNPETEKYYNSVLKRWVNDEPSLPSSAEQKDFGLFGAAKLYEIVADNPLCMKNSILVGTSPTYGTMTVDNDSE